VEPRTANTSNKNSVLQPSTDLGSTGSFLMPSRMPKEVRNDPEVAAKLEELDKAAKVYMAFDMQKLQNDMSRELEGDIQRIN
jgi:hypothetical protein